jgi:hypothetical protein
MEPDEGESHDLANPQLDEEQEIAAAAREVRRVNPIKDEVHASDRPSSHPYVHQGSNGSAYPSQSQKQLRSNRHEPVI